MRVYKTVERQSDGSWKAVVHGDVEEARALDVEDCGGCSPSPERVGVTVRYCPIHGLDGLAVR